MDVVTLWMYINTIGFVIFLYQVVFFHCIRFDSVSGYISPLLRLNLQVFCIGVHVVSFSVCFLCRGYSHLLAFNICFLYICLYYRVLKDWKFVYLTVTS